MDGYYAGIALYNKQKGTTAKLLGWDAAKQTGTFVGGDNPWGDPAKGEQLAKTFIDQGADIVASGRGRHRQRLDQGDARGQEAGPIGVDTDQALSAARVRRGDPDLRTEGHRRRGPRHDQEELGRRSRRRELRRHARQQAASRIAPFHDLDSVRSRPTSRPRSTSCQGGHRLRRGQGLPTTSSSGPAPTRSRPARPPVRIRGRAARIQRRSTSEVLLMRLELRDITKQFPGRPGQRRDLDLGRPRRGARACSARTAPARRP